MAERALTSEQILAASEDVLRRFGSGKTTVVDVARSLGVSHGSVYRHFPSKAALRAAVTARWLNQSHGPLSAIAHAREPAPDRLRRWLVTLFDAKRRKALDDPELFATYAALAREPNEVVDDHVNRLLGQLVEIVADGMDRGDFNAADPSVTARAVFDSAVRFHSPVHVAEWRSPGIDAELDAVCTLILSGLLAHR